jgi:predicted Zn-dependent protease
MMSRETPRALRQIGTAACAAILLGSCGSPAERAAAAGAEAQQLLDAGQYRQAAARLDYALHQRDDVPGLWLLLGRAKAALRDASGAYSAYRNVLDQDPQSREALLALSQLSLVAGNFEEARDYSERLLLLSPGEPNGLVIQGFAAVGMGRFADAAQSAETVLESDPSNELALVIKSMIAYRQRNLAAAAAVLKDSFDRGTDNQDVLRQLRRIARKAGDAKQLLLVTQRIASTARDDEAAQFDFIRSLYLVNQAERAGQLLAKLPATRAAQREAALSVWMDTAVPVELLARDKAIREQPWLNLAYAEFCLRLGRADVALAALRSESGAAVAPGNLERQAALGLAQLMLGQARDAEMRIRAVLALEPRQPTALLARGSLALLRGDADAALRDARVVISDNPALPAGYALLARTYRHAGNPLLADKAMLDGSAAAPDSAEQLRAITSYFALNGRADQALTAARDFTARNPSSRAGWTVRSKLCAGAGDPSCAARASEMLRRLGGGSVDYASALGDHDSTSDEGLFAR